MSAFDKSRTPCARADVVAQVVAQFRLDLSTERAMQDGVEGCIRRIHPDDPSLVSREHRLGPGDIPDFLLFGDIVLELKGRRHRAPTVLRQLVRYAAYPEVVAIVLLTARAMTMPSEIAGKPVRVVNAGRAWL